MKRFAFGTAMLAVLVLTRWALAPQYLFYFDSINFALALDKFDPSIHQPQPPGYPLFVALIRLIHLVASDPQTVLVTGGLILGAAALLLLWRLASDMYGETAGFLAAALLVCNPPFWLGGITNPVRIGLALCSSGIALLAWRVLRNEANSAGRFYLACAALGLAAGFRPIDCTLLIPLLLFVWWQTGRSVPRLAIGFASLIGGVLPWWIPTVLAVGGLTSWFRMMWTYGRDQFHGTSALFGAQVASATEMARWAIIWNGMGVVTWIWALAFVRRRLQFDDRVPFLTVWLVPGLLFSAFVHIGDPDQALLTIVPLCLIGGAVLSAFAERFRTRAVAPLAAGVATLNVILFFFPPGHIAARSGYQTVESTDARIHDAFTAIRSLDGHAPLTIVHYGAEVSWRHFFYYFPHDFLLYLPQEEGEIEMSFRERQLVEGGPAASQLPARQRVVLIAPHLNKAWLGEHGWHAAGPVYYRNGDPAANLEIGKYQLHMGPETAN